MICRDVEGQLEALGALSEWGVIQCPLGQGMKAAGDGEEWQQNLGIT